MALTPFLPKILFYEDGHLYLNTKNGERWPSMSSVVKAFSPKLDTSYWQRVKAVKGAISKEKWRGFLVKEGIDMRLDNGDLNPKWAMPSVECVDRIIDQLSDKERADARKVYVQLEVNWTVTQNIASMRGSRFHYGREDADLAAGGSMNPITGVWQPTPLFVDKKLADNHNLTNSLKDLPDGFYPELLVWDEELQLVGQVDRAWIWTDANGVRWVYFRDYKTNFHKMEEEAFFDETLHYPFNDLPATHSNKYLIQQGGYMHIMERAGFRCAGIALDWVEDFGEGKVVVEPLIYYPDKLSEAFRLFNQAKISAN